MAGESPDRSKQRESSAEPTSGSASPVPEARSSSPDPRLAVARESVSLGGVDTATRIFSVRDLPKPPEEAEEGPAEASATPSAPKTSPTPEKRAETADGAEPDTGDASGTAPTVDKTDEPDGSDTEADGTDAGSAAAEADGTDAGSAAAEADESDAGEGPDAGRAGAGSEASGTGSGTGSAAAEASGTGEGPEAGSAAAEADESDAGEGPDAGRAGAGSEASGTGPGAGSAAAEASGTGEGSEAGTAAAEADESDAGEGPDAGRAGAGSEASGTGAGSGAGSAAAGADESDAGEGPDVSGSEEPEAGGGAASDGDARLRDAVAAWVAKGDAPAEAASESEDAADADAADAEDAADADAADAAGDPGAEDVVEKDGQPAVDQPTAVFKAPRPAVDQPTTMLKLGKAPEREPEAEAERTSKFVALKPLDEPRAPRPKTEVTAAVPQVGPERTTQQPLPPKPPLDLLAELTNTPPPPPSPLRTVVRRVKIWTPLVLLLVVVFAVAQSLRPLPSPTLKLTAEQTYTFEGGKVDIPWPADGQAALDVQGVGTFGSVGGQKPVPIASVAKVMTAYIILRDHPLASGADGPKIKIDQAAEDQVTAKDESTVPVTAGDSITQREALTDILIASANNVARLLARWDSGSEKAFVTKMNATAKDLGMTNTTYTDPSGLNNTTVSTAVDQVKLARKAMELPAFREVAAQMSYFDYKGNKHNNYNRLVGYNDVVGIKTGTTTSALGNLVFAAKKDVNGETYRVIGAVVRQPAGGDDNTILGGALAAGKELMLAAQDALKSAKILKKGDVVGYVDDGLGGHTPVVLTKDVTAVGWSGLKVKLSFTSDEVPHTAKAGTKVGTLTVGDGEGGAVTVPVTLQKDLTEPGFADKLTRVS